MERREHGEEEWVKQEEEKDEKDEKGEEKDIKEEKEIKEDIEEDIEEKDSKQKGDIEEEKTDVKETKEAIQIKEVAKEERAEGELEEAKKDDVGEEKETKKADRELNDAVSETNESTQVVDEAKEPSHSSLPSYRVSSNKQPRLQATHLVEVARHILSHHRRQNSFASRRTLDRPSHFLLRNPVFRHRQRETPHVSTSQRMHAAYTF